MSDFRSDDHDPESCPGCRPIVIDPVSGHPHRKLTLVAEKSFLAATPEQRKAWHRVTCLNSRDPTDLILAHKIVEGIEREMKHD
jgi:hypothetical protein